MTRPGDSQPRRAAGRRAGDSGTRAAILDAARACFADRGYDGATIRAIAADAGVDPALVHHFYGTKERLFAAAMRLPVVPSEILTAALATPGPGQSAGLGDQLIRAALRAWDDDEVRATFVGLLRSALTSEQAAAMMRQFISEAILGPVARAAMAAAPDTDPADPHDAEYRAAIVASQMVGLLVTRYLLALGPVAAASGEDLAATVGPTLQRYLVGPIRPAGQDQPAPGGPPPGSPPAPAGQPGGGHPGGGRRGAG
ncbi:MAG TPA: TetR family transcriptional regulator [Streptosporangiaceae bacterium]